MAKISALRGNIFGRHKKAANSSGGLLTRLKRNWLPLVLLLYFLLSILYQALCPHVTLPFLRRICGEANAIDITPHIYLELPRLRGEIYILRLHYPRVVRFTDGKPQQFIAVWMWPVSFTSVPVGTEFEVTLKVQGEGIVFVDEQGKEVEPVLKVPLGETKAQAPRRVIYVQRKPGPISSSELCTDIVVGSPQAGDLFILCAFKLRPESATAASLRRTLDFLLGTWVFSVLSAGLALVKFLMDEQERRREERIRLHERIEKLETSPPARLGEEYLDIWRTVRKGRYKDLEGILDSTWKSLQARYPYKPWLLNFRRRIAGLIEEEKFSEAEKVVNEAQDARLWAEQEVDTESIRQFIEARENPDRYKPNPEELLTVALKGFAALGLSSAGTAIKLAGVLKEKGDFENLENLLKEKWYEAETSAAGRFLLRKLATNSADSGLRKRVELWLREWEARKPAPPRSLPSPCELWPESPKALEEAHLRAIKFFRSEVEPGSTRWFTPFGPEKAEEDPRLPTLPKPDEVKRPAGMFWERHRLWDEVVRARSGIFISPPGSGRTAFILMGRHIRRFWGMKPALSLYLPISEPLSEEILLRKLQEALTGAILCTLAEDPFWLLGAPQDIQEAVAAFLLRWFKGWDALFSRLKGYGLDGTASDDPDARILWETLMQYEVPRAEPAFTRKELVNLLRQLRRPLDEATRFRREGEPFSLFVWGDIRSDEYSSRWLEELWNWEELRQVAVLKIFVSCLDEEKYNPLFKLEWTSQDLCEMAEQRMRATEFYDEARWQQVIDKLKNVPPNSFKHWVEKKRLGELQRALDPARPVESVLGWLSKRASGSPAELIRQGNRLMEILGSVLLEQEKRPQGDAGEGGSSNA